MTLTASDAIAEITHAISGLPSATAMRLVNEAGRHVCNMHAWNFLKRPKTSLASVAGQAYIELPADFGSILAIEIEGGFTHNWKRTDAATFLRLESGVWDESGWAYWSILENAASTDGTAPGPRLAIWPAPTTANASFAALRYRAKWADLTDDGDTVQLPDFAETLFLQTVRAFARGYEEDEDVTLDERLAVTLAGPIYRAARKQDADSQWYVGTLKGGAGDAGIHYRTWEGSFSAPS